MKQVFIIAHPSLTVKQKEYFIIVCLIVNIKEEIIIYLIIKLPFGTTSVCFLLCCLFFNFELFILCWVQLINNAVMVSGEQWRDSTRHIQASILPQTLLPTGLAHNIDQCIFSSTTYLLIWGEIKDSITLYFTLWKWATFFYVQCEVFNVSFFSTVEI